MINSHSVLTIPRCHFTTELAYMANSATTFTPESIAEKRLKVGIFFYKNTEE
ncbi:hypothetical protein [Fortiea sp. LEGE XX443]|uniref:hypothetical protein n=1 Tax=Fortiea sp. LEGE XX443 TaxID=1828611 RepID=UPI001D15902A|nr:hypothetical protein [Fortiea sp. LEGE XX443]